MILLKKFFDSTIMIDDVSSRFDKKLDDLENQMAPLIELQELLINCQDNEIENFVEYIQDNKLTSNKTLLNEVLQSINMAIIARPNNLLFYIDLIVALKEVVQNNFRPIEVWNIFESNQNVLLALYEEGCIDMATIKKKSYRDRKLLAFFHNELIQYDEKYFKNSINELGMNDEIRSISMDENKFFENRKIGHCEWELADIIRRDDVGAFQDYINQTNMNLDTQIHPTVFESDQTINSRFTPLPTLMEYAAFFNSINIFKYLWMNHATLTELLPRYAISGGNCEMVHMCEERKSLCFNEECLNIAVVYHHGDMADYLREEYCIKYTVWILQRSIKCFNLEEMFKILHSNIRLVKDRDVYGMSPLHFACECGHLEIAKFLIDMYKGGINERNWRWV